MIFSMGAASRQTSRPTAYLAVCGLAIMLGAACQGGDDVEDTGSEIEETPDGVAGLFQHIQHVGTMREGFKEISSDWDAFADRWAFVDPLTFDSLENEALIMYSTEAELRDIYRFRGDFYEQLASDSVRNVACGPRRTLEDVRSLLGELRTEANMRQVGRSLARQHEGSAPWTPPVPIPIDERHRDAFTQYLVEAGLTDVARTFTAASEGGDVTDEALCVAQGALYTLAADHPDDRVGDLRLFDYVRSLEASILLRR